MTHAHVWTGAYIGLAYAILASWVLGSVLSHIVCGFARAITRWWDRQRA